LKCQPGVHVRSSFQLRGGSSSSSFDSLGLLRGISVNKAQYYTTELQMDSVADMQWLRELGLPYEAAKKDTAEQSIPVAEYLATVQDALVTFVMDSGEVHDREDFYNFLNSAVERRGKICLVLGGKSVGKSLVLADFTKQLQQNTSAFFPLLLNGRDSLSCITL
jgi:hypothetical protein